MIHHQLVFTLLFSCRSCGCENSVISLSTWQIITFLLFKTEWLSFKSILATHLFKIHISCFKSCCGIHFFSHIQKTKHMNATIYHCIGIKFHAIKAQSPRLKLAATCSQLWFTLSETLASMLKGCQCHFHVSVWGGGVTNAHSAHSDQQATTGIRVQGYNSKPQKHSFFAMQTRDILG